VPGSCGYVEAGCHYIRPGFGMLPTVQRRGEGWITLKGVVRAVGIEPTLLAERDFESRASTNSTTPALRIAYSATIKMRNVKSEQCRYSQANGGAHRRLLRMTAAAFHIRRRSSMAGSGI
jgi:hypothetical protein